MYGARIIVLRRALVAPTPLKVPVAVRVSGTERRIACPAILRCPDLKCPSAYRDERDSQCDNNELHENLCNLSVSRSEKDSPSMDCQRQSQDSRRRSAFDGAILPIGSLYRAPLGFIAFPGMSNMGSMLMNIRRRYAP